MVQYTDNAARRFNPCVPVSADSPVFSRLAGVLPPSSGRASIPLPLLELLPPRVQPRDPRLRLLQQPAPLRERAVVPPRGDFRDLRLQPPRLRLRRGDVRFHRVPLALLVVRQLLALRRCRRG